MDVGLWGCRGSGFSGRELDLRRLAISASEDPGLRTNILHPDVGT